MAKFFLGFEGRKAPKIHKYSSYYCGVLVNNTGVSWFVHGWSGNCTENIEFKVIANVNEASKTDREKQDRKFKCKALLNRKSDRLPKEKSRSVLRSLMQTRCLLKLVMSSSAEVHMCICVFT